MITLVTGGVRSGKSRHALQLAQDAAADRSSYYIATAEATDGSMQERIEAHRKEREGLAMQTLEVPVELGTILESLSPEKPLVLVDCLTLWLNNLLYYRPEKVESEIESMLAVAERFEGNLIFVSNEVGLGGLPGNTLARQFCDLAGALNRQVAERAETVFFTVSGIPVKIK